MRRPRDLRLIAGADAAYCGKGERLVAAVVVLALPALEVIVTMPWRPCWARAGDFVCRSRRDGRTYW